MPWVLQKKGCIMSAPTAPSSTWTSTTPTVCTCLPLNILRAHMLQPYLCPAQGYILKLSNKALFKLLQLECCDLDSSA